MVLAKRKAGIAEPTEKAGPERKRRRVKTLSTMLSVHNMLLQCTGAGLEKFVVVPRANGKYGDPFQWCHINLCTDQGADNIAAEHFLAYEGQVNCHFDHDLTHGAHNDIVKDVVKEVGLWRHVLSLMTAMNVAYGSTMSPPRLEQVRNTVSEHFKDHSCEDPLFQVMLPHLVRQLGKGEHIADEDVAANMWGTIRTCPLLWFKNAKCNLAKYLLAVKRTREDQHLLAVKALLYTYASYSLGYKDQKPSSATGSSSSSSATASSSSSSATASPSSSSATRVAAALDGKTVDRKSGRKTVDLLV